MTIPDPCFQRWTHSREEDDGDIKVYRPAEYAFPPARGREGLEFRPDGDFIFYQISPTDATQGLKGEWSVKEDNSIQIELQSSNMNDYEIVIMECTLDILKIREVSSAQN